MRNTLLSRTPAPLDRNSVMATPLTSVPTIRLTTATPSASDSPLENRSATNTILAPKAQAETRKRLVPKKSKLNLLGGSRREKSKDLSDVTRRIGAPPATTGRSFDIYVDPADDPDIGEIVVLKKKKSRAGLNDLHWGALGDVTNVGREETSEPKTAARKPLIVESTLKSKNDDKWWTIGRGRKDSKEKPKDKVFRSKSKEKLKEITKDSSKDTVKSSLRQSIKSRNSILPLQAKKFETRQRSQSLDATMLFNGSAEPSANCITVPMPDDQEDVPRRGHIRTNTSPSLFGARPTTPEGIAAVTQPSEDKEQPRNGSIALRAMRSVRSLARISSWAQLKNMPTDDAEQPAEKNVEMQEVKEKKKKDRTRSMRNSKSSFEALKNTFGSVRKSVDLSGTIRSVSSQATVTSNSSGGTVRNTRRDSGASVASTIKNVNSGSRGVEPIIGRASKSSGASTIRWNDQVDRTGERRSPEMENKSSNSTGKRRGSRESPTSRKRPGLASLFSDLTQDSSPIDSSGKSKFPVQGVEFNSPNSSWDPSTTVLDISSTTISDTPPTKIRRRPLSEQLLGRERPKGIMGDKDTGVIQILDNVTTDLASLINRLDLEATPTASPILESPGKTFPEGSKIDGLGKPPPRKNVSRQFSTEKLMGSLRALTRRRFVSVSAAESLGNRIAPWPISDVQVEGGELVAHRPVFSPEVKREARTSVSSPPAPYEAMPVFYPLPVPSHPGSKDTLLPTQTEQSPPERESISATSFATFGKRSSKDSRASRGSATPTTIKGRQPRGGRGSSASQLSQSLPVQDDVFMDSKSSRGSGTSRTVDSIGSFSYSLDTDDPNYDIPGELKMLLSTKSNRDSTHSTINERGLLFERPPAMHPLPPSPGTPPSLPLPSVFSTEPVFRAPLPSELSDFNDDAFIASDEENETKKSFDFTAELNKLDLTGAVENRSFAVQLEEAFRTPEKHALRGLGSKIGLCEENTSDLPALPISPVSPEPPSERIFEDSVSECLNLDNAHDENMCIKQPFQIDARPVFSRPSQGRLDLNFKFGGNSLTATDTTKSPEEHLSFSDDASPSSRYSQSRSHLSEDSISGNPMSMSNFLAYHGRNQSGSSFASGISERQISLSDIIPPPSHDSRRHSFTSVNEDESAVLNSIFTKADNLSDVDLSLDPECSPQCARQCAINRINAHSRQISDVSFSGLSTYSERRRGFEYGALRPAFYPPPISGPPQAENSLQVPNAQWRSSLMSVGSVSSYGHILRAGAKDPFDYGVPGRPISQDMSYTVDDTFSFLQHDPMRQRVDSDASVHSIDSYSQLRPDAHQRRNRRQVDSMISLASGPPVSLYNRGFNAARATFARRQRTSSFESIASTFSAHHVGRPGVGDKMFERDHGVPLASISASPSQLDSSMIWQTSYDSIVDNGDRDQDSLIDETGRRSLGGSQESLFGCDNRHAHARPRHPGLLPLHQFRPISVYSLESHDSPKRDDDTMISMIGGGYVRRRSIRSTLEGSPCARVEKRQQRRYLGRILTRIPSGDDYDYSLEGSPDKARLISRPSFTSTSSFDVASSEYMEGSPDKARLINRASFASKDSIKMAYRNNVENSLDGSYLSRNPSRTSTLSIYSVEQDDAEGVAGKAHLVKKTSFTSLLSLDVADRIPEAVVEENPDVSRLSTYDVHFGGNRMSMARRGLLHRQSLENCCLVADGEYGDSIVEKPVTVFRRPEPAARMRSGSTGQTSSGTDTPPLSLSRASTNFTGSQCSIDLERLNVLLASPSNSDSISNRDRLRTRGDGHRRRISEARASRTASVYETIEEAPELFDNISLSEGYLKSPVDSTISSKLSAADINIVRWENEDVGPALRMMRALQKEARLAVDASQRQWADTAYSVDALQSFKPPLNPAAWKALLEHSQKSFGPLPSELHGCARRSRSRTTSRPSPYPLRTFTPASCDYRPPTIPTVPKITVTEQFAHPLKDVPANPNVISTCQPWEPSFSSLKPILPFSAEIKGKSKDTSRAGQGANLTTLGSSPRLRMMASARKLMAGSAKQTSKKSPHKNRQNKENAGQGISIRAESLRFVRPRPRGRPSAAPRALRL